MEKRLTWNELRIAGGKNRWLQHQLKAENLDGTT